MGNLGNLAIVIGLYVALRCIEIMSRSKDSFVSEGVGVAVRVCAGLALAATGILIWDMLMTGSSQLVPSVPIR